MLLEQRPGCTWMLLENLTFHHVWGQSIPVFGRPAGQLAGTNLLHILPPNIHEAWKDRIARVFQGETLLLREQRGDSIFSFSYYPLRDECGEIMLAAGFAIDTSAIRKAEQELRATALKVIRAQETERTRLSRFLHDEVGQCLSAAGLQLDLLRMDLEPTVPGITERTAEVQQVLERVMERVREFSHELNPDVVERAGLHSALDRLVGRLRRNFAGTLRLMVDSSLRIEPGLAGAFYKIAHEAVDNAIRHSGCTQVEVLLKSTRPGPALEVRDNGAGFDTGEAKDTGLGLLIMQHCAAEAGLDLAVSSVRQRGTTVRATLRAKTEHSGS
jgi:two-component system NarL family sensor kinase